jgi:hypothetical protein
MLTDRIDGDARREDLLITSPFFEELSKLSITICNLRGEAGSIAG